jgi:hypothetical protein
MPAVIATDSGEATTYFATVQEREVRAERWILRISSII